MTEYSIKYNRLRGPNVTQDDTKNSGGTITPRLIVFHYTAGASAKGTVEFFKSRKSKASAHLVIARDGTTTCLKAFDKKTWHAGPSYYDGFSGLNKYSIGIEISNLGFLRKTNEGVYTNWRGDIVSNISDEEVISMPYPKAGSGDLFWEKYTDEQLQALDGIVEALLKQYPTIEHIVGHEDIDTRGWKTDPGPAFPMGRYLELLDDRSAESLTAKEFSCQRGLVKARKLNIRSGPDMLSEIIDYALRDDVVMIENKHKDWYQISLPNEGYVHSDFIERF